ncbi:MAG: type IV secretory system conjugative DNA transfer family protein, partial [Amphiplicatus sp.]
DNCHVRIAFSSNDERTAKRISDALGTATELRAQRNYAGHRLAPWLAHVMVSRQETARPLLTPGEVMQLPNEELIALISGAPPIRAKKLQYYRDRNFSARRLPAVSLVGANGRYPDAPAAKADDWSGIIAKPDKRLDQPWFDLVKAGAPESEGGLAQTPELDPLKSAPIYATERDEKHEYETDDLAAARRLKDLARETARRAVGLDRSMPSLLPGI